jgi:glycosyltransferase involved in cell wall biosynthesis
LLETDTYIGTLVWNRTHFSIQTNHDLALHDVDVVIMQRLMHDTLPEHMKLAQKAGQIIINDLDDWYWGLDTSNLAFASSHPKNSPHENTNHYRKVLATSDRITVSTPYLRDRLMQMFRNCPPIDVLENTVDVNRFKIHEHITETKPIVGWVGSTNHRSGDLEVVSGTIPPLQKLNLIDLQHSGNRFDAPSLASKWNITETSVITLPACEPEDYPNLLTMDIGIAPLRDTPFNHAKSDIKVLEYSASGIPWVASDLPAYETLQKLWGVGRIAKKNKAKEWQRHIKELLDPKVRAEEGLALREASWSRDILVGAKTLNSYLTSLR